MPILDFIGQYILVDEIHRRNRTTNGEVSIKFLFATDCLSRFSRLYDIGETDSKYTSNEFVDKLLEIKADFGLNTASDKDQKFYFRADKSPVHQKAAKDQRLLAAGICIVFHDKTRPDSQQIPELDERISVVSRLMRPALANEIFTPHMIFRIMAFTQRRIERAIQGQYN